MQTKDQKRSGAVARMQSRVEKYKRGLKPVGLSVEVQNLLLKQISTLERDIKNTQAKMKGNYEIS